MPFSCGARRVIPIWPHLAHLVRSRNSPWNKSFFKTASVNWVKAAFKNGQRLLRSCQKSKELRPEFYKLLASANYFILNNNLKQHAEIVWHVMSEITIWQNPVLNEYSLGMWCVVRGPHIKLIAADLFLGVQQFMLSFHFYSIFGINQNNCEILVRSCAYTSDCSFVAHSCPEGQNLL